MGGRPLFNPRLAVPLARRPVDEASAARRVLAGAVLFGRSLLRRPLGRRDRSYESLKSQSAAKSTLERPSVTGPRYPPRAGLPWSIRRRARALGWFEHLQCVPGSVGVGEVSRRVSRIAQDALGPCVLFGLTIAFIVFATQLACRLTGATLRPQL